MSKKYGFIILIIFILLSFTLITAFSYSLWSQNLEGDPQVMSVGCFDVSYESNNTISLLKTYPVSDTEGLEQTPFSFTISNLTCSLDSEYVVNINTLTGTMDENWIKVAYQIGDGPVSEPVLLTSLESGDAIADNTVHAYKVLTGNVYTGSTVEVKIWMWMKEDVGNSGQGAKLNTRIYVTNNAVHVNGVEMLIDKANKDASMMFNDENAKQSQMFKFVQNATDQVTNEEQLTEYRFIGGGTYCKYRSEDGNNEVYHKTDYYGFCNSSIYLRTSTFISDPNQSSSQIVNGCIPSENNGSGFRIDCDYYELVDTIIGEKVNNYLKFNCNSDGTGCETWRIIGVFTDTDGEKNIKIMKDTAINGGSFAFDNKNANVGSSISSNGSNDWTDAQLMYALNNPFITSSTDLMHNYTLANDYIKDANNNIIYQKGYVPKSISTGDETYGGQEFSWSLKKYYYDMVDNFTYYLGNIPNTYTSTMDVVYSNERSNSVYTNANLPFARSLNWRGKIALPYMSDIMYTYGKGVEPHCAGSANNSTCELFVPSSASWLFDSLYSYLLLSVKEDRVNSRVNTFFDTSSPSNDSDYIKPVLYLKSDIKLSGQGTAANPYEIVY